MKEKMELDYCPPYEIDSEMLNLVAEIMERVGNISNNFNINGDVKLLRRNKIHSIHSSLAIESNSLTLNQVEDIISGKKVIGDGKEILEVKNALKAYDLVETINPYSIEDLCKTHYEMMKGLTHDAGEFREQEEGVFDGDTPIHIAPPAKLVRDLMEQLFLYLKKSKDNILIKSCVFHYEFEYIHPFSDGNGRMGRLWQTALLCNWKPIFKCLPIENVLKKYQEEYYAAFATSNAKGNSNDFIVFMLKAILTTIKQSEIKPVAKFVSSQVEELMKVVDEYPRTAQELMKLLGLKSLASFRNNYLKPALSAKLISMTLPGKKTSRNQRYIKAD